MSSDVESLGCTPPADDGLSDPLEANATRDSHSEKYASGTSGKGKELNPSVGAVSKRKTIGPRTDICCNSGGTPELTDLK